MRVHSAVMPNFKRLAVIAIAVLSAASCLYFGFISTLAGIAAIFIFTLSLKSPKILFYIIFLWCAFAGILVNNTDLGKIEAITYVDEALVAMLLFSLMIKIKGYQVSRRLFRLIAVIFLFCAVAAASTFANHTSPIGLINFLSTYLKFFAVFICAVILLDGKEMKNLIIFMAYFMLFQVAVASVQFFSYGRGNILVGSEIDQMEDAATGLFGMYGAMPLGHLAMIFIILSASLSFFMRNKLWLFFLAISLYCFIITFTEQNYPFLIFFLLIATIFLLWGRIKARARPLIFYGVAIVFFFMTFLLFKADFSPMKRYATLLSHPKKLEEMGKVQSLILIKNIMLCEPTIMLFGVGPGNFSSGMSGKLGGEYYKQYIEFRIKQVKSVVDYWWSNFSSLLSETGIIGYLLYLTAFILVLSPGIKVLRYKDGAVDRFDRAVAFASCSTVLFLLYISFFSNALEWIALTFPPTIIVAYAWKSCDLLKAADI